MDEAEELALFELADLILALSRQIQAAKQGAEIYPGTSWTPLESAVMRFIDRNPGTTAGEAAEATRLISSNFSRALRALEKKGLVRRERDPHDARRLHLYPTEQAHENLRRLRGLWSELLAGTVTDPADIESVARLLRGMEAALNARQ
ncbi:MAG TPA: MarR family transcriptional regulator [Pseudonocardiaceae bacterium]|nr:MarR family transcriptional regulator [Pseudonocardiaceae bacterium]